MTAGGGSPPPSGEIFIFRSRRTTPDHFHAIAWCGAEVAVTAVLISGLDSAGYGCARRLHLLLLLPAKEAGLAGLWACLGTDVISSPELPLSSRSVLAAASPAPPPPPLTEDSRRNQTASILRRQALSSRNPSTRSVGGGLNSHARSTTHHEAVWYRSLCSSSVTRLPSSSHPPMDDAVALSCFAGTTGPARRPDPSKSAVSSVACAADGEEPTSHLRTRLPSSSACFPVSYILSTPSQFVPLRARRRNIIH
ncbi:hypothetical protein HPP92_028746 [Vanilla planifolia]|uniref:Uncharacterized protein n=1 Tax=Vanilla planifolia TaxID=51239 RepID=A0A835P7J1_VANPL|nr:hypothetical protein HPP92_028746 [Vanilla planifolia]KAG0446657.1 hypothetical protein HPP92_028735 [Vanilla planifolia]